MRLKLLHTFRLMSRNFLTGGDALGVDYVDAGQRHWADAELLHREQRLPNADHLYELAAECLLKGVMVGLGMTLNANGRPPKQYAQHIDALWALFSSFAHGRGQTTYASILGSKNPFANWSVHQRYWDSKEVGQPEVTARR
jgi:hypothetical protein